MSRSRPSFAIAGAGMGGLAAAAALRRAGFGVHVYEQAHRFARIGAGIQMMPNSMKVLRALGVEERIRGDVLRTVLAPQSRLGLRRGDARAADARKPVRRAVSLHAPRRSARRARLGGPRRIRSSRQEACRAGPGRRAGDAHVRGWFTRARRRVDRRRRRAFGGARRHHRPRHADSQRPDRLSGHLSSALVGRDIGRSRTKWWGIDRHIVIYYTTARSERDLLRDERARAGRMADARIVVGQRATSTSCGRRTRDFIPTCAPCWMAAPIATSGPSSSAIRCLAGAPDAWCSSATPVIR